MTASGFTRPPRRNDWLRVGFAMFVLGFGTNHFTPLLEVYRDLHGTSAQMLTLTFGAYALGLVPSLFIFGPLSDRIGRRKVLLPALALSMLASAILLGGALGWTWSLLLGRVTMGVAMGMATSASSAWIAQLSVDNPRAGARRATISLTAGFGAGPLVSGVIASFFAAPALTPYAIHLWLAAVALVLLLPVPDVKTRTSAPRRPATRARGLPKVAGSRYFLGAVAIWAPWTFGMSTSSMVANPAFIRVDVEHPALLTGVVGMVAMLAGILVQPVIARFDNETSGITSKVPLSVVGLLLAGLGLLVSVSAALSGGTAALLLAATVMGMAYGTLLVAGLKEVNLIAPPDQLASLMGVFYALVYAGFAVPFLLSLAVPIVGGATGWPDSSSYAAVLGAGVLLSLTPIVPILRATAGGRPSV